MLDGLSLSIMSNSFRVMTVLAAPSSHMYLHLILLSFIVPVVGGLISGLVWSRQCSAVEIPAFKLFGPWFAGGDDCCC